MPVRPALPSVLSCMRWVLPRRNGLPRVVFFFVMVFFGMLIWNSIGRLRSPRPPLIGPPGKGFRLVPHTFPSRKRPVATVLPSTRYQVLPTEKIHNSPALTFSEDGEKFLLRGKPFRILSGELHYFRVVPQYWEDRLRRLKAAGLNTVSTYVAWNLHEPHPGEFDFERNTRTDLVQFIKTAHKVGLYVIFRPGPYICAEWEFGGLPGWLLRSNGNEIRTNGPWFMKAVKQYFAQIFEMVKTLQSGYGGPIIAVQLENEYGTFGNSRPYLEALRQAAEDGGIMELLFKCDDHNGLPKGLVQLPGVLQAVNGNDRISWHINQLRKNQEKKSPIFVAELWTGWFTLAGTEFRGKTAVEISTATKEWLEKGASINYYMWHGGSNFFHNGAVNIPPFSLITSSYDYDAPVSENGTLTPKFFAIRKQLKASLGDEHVTFGDIPPPIPVKAYGIVQVTSYVTLDGLVEFLPRVRLDQVCSMEELPYHMSSGQVMGFLLYRHRQLVGNGKRKSVNVAGLADFGAVLLNGQLIGHVNQQFDSGTGYFALPAESMKDGPVNTLDVLVGSSGRNNYLPDGSEKKGLLWPVQVGTEALTTWEAYPMEFDQKFLRRIEKHVSEFKTIGTSSLPQGPLLLRAEFAIAEKPCDTYLRLDGFGRGLVVLNGEVLGRHWEAGPQRTLYVPAPMLRQGGNVLLIMEMMKTPVSPSIKFVDSHQLGKPR